jgi:hypothetical protein
VTSMFFGLEGYAEFVFLALRLEFSGLSLVMRSFAFSITLVISEFEVTNTTTNMHCGNGP